MALTVPWIRLPGSSATIAVNANDLLIRLNIINSKMKYPEAMTSAPAIKEIIRIA